MVSDSPRKTGLFRLLLLAFRPKGRARTSAEMIQFRSVLRFAGLFVLTIFVPSLLVAWLGIAGTQGGEKALRSEVVLESDGALESCYRQFESLFESFETTARTRILQHRSSLDAPLEISSFLLLSLTLDMTGRIIEPFDLPEETTSFERVFYLAGPYQKAHEAEREGRVEDAIALYRKAAQRAHGMTQRGASELQRARLMAVTGHQRESEDLYADIIAEYGQLREPNGFLIGDVARLRRAELQLLRSPEMGIPSLEDTVDQILARRWVVGRGGDPAIARHVLDLLEGRVPATSVVSRRNRVRDRSAALFHAERLIPELELIGAKGPLLKVASGQFSYTRGDEVIWATTWIGENLHAFALDTRAIADAVLEIAEEGSHPDGKIRILVTSPETPPSSSIISHRALMPWLTGWSFAAQPWDPEGLADSIRRKRAVRLMVIVTSVMLIAFGAFMLTRLVSREMELAAMKTSFAASVSHELRSPITQIRLKGESLLLGLAETEADRQKHYAAIVHESERLSRLVDNVLDFAAIERGTKQYNLRPADIAQTVSNTVEIMRSSIESRGLRLELDLPEDLPVVRHDPDAVAQVLINLLTNAAKYGASGRWIGVRVFEVEVGVEIQVADRGIGISPLDLPHIFERFYRSNDPRARKHKGTGIGLAIVRYIMDAHAGQALVASNPGRGTIFRLIFPFSPPTERAHGARS